MEKLTIGQRVADIVAAFMGSWPFIIIQSTILAVYVIANITNIVHFDPYPFILLNLVLSFQAAYSSPFIMMANNRQSEIDRANAKSDYEIDKYAETRIEELIVMVSELQRQMAALGTRQA